jgi:hypothetical protein
MFIVGAVGKREGHGDDFSSMWGPDQRDALSELAAAFKKSNDKCGLYLCAAAEEEVCRIERLQASGQGVCPIELQFLVSLAISRKAGGLHELAHLLFPQVQDLFLGAVALAKQQEAGVE